MEVPGASRQVHGGLANDATDTLESSRHLNQGKRHLSAKDDQSREMRHKKRNNVRLDAEFDPAAAGPNSVNAPAAGTLFAANGDDEWTFPDLYDFADGELDNADFELNIFASNDSAATSKSPGAQASEDIWQFLSLPPSPDNDKPPPSVLREFDNVSTSTCAPKFDPNLQYSTPSSASPAVDDSIGSGKDVSESISWDYVNCQLHQTYTDQVLSFSKERNESIKADQSHVAEPVTPPSTAVSAPAGMLLRPGKVCFHLQELLQAKESIYENQPEEHGDSVDIGAREILKSSDPALKCYCQCTLQRDARAELGYALILHCIREIKWKEIMAAMDFLGRKDLDDPGMCSSY